ncbi:hypothetical protein BVRB_8g184850 [Beta vulgaris subsp. vulgaris]|uniref:Uncharacterized protein n=1 Tax=Beta vulgaris subsp. vulgaris TaxID=3555 RepID=A0A0J8BRQ7_BETVV|nr:hypothetical protein BVRB_8g184850 [Beta vulgaris subsp. vulgaris]
MVLEDVIMEEENDDEYDKSLDDDEYDANKEEDKGEPEDIAHDEQKHLQDEEIRKVQLLEELGDNAPPIDNNAREDYPTVSSISMPPTKAGKELQVSTKTPRRVATKKRKGRDATKGINFKTNMTLEYDDLGQPCSQWRVKNGQHIGFCMRKLNILVKWKDVPKAMKKSLWEGTCVS